MARAQNPTPKVPLFDESAEEALIGAMISSAEARSIALATCSLVDFNSPVHRAVFSAIETLMQEGQDVDAVTVHAQLEAGAYELDQRVDWLQFVMDLQANTAWSSRNAGTYATIVAEKADARRAYGASVEFQHQLAQGMDPATAISTMFTSFSQSQTHRLITMHELTEAALDLLEHGRPKNGIATQLPELDDILHGGFLPKNLVVVAARPSMGKSAFALSVVASAAERGHKCLFVSGEMSHVEIAMRLVARYSGIPSSTSMNAEGPEEYTDAEIGRFGEAIAKMAALPIKFLDEAVTISAIRARVQAEAMTSEPFELVIIDYLQLMKPETRQGPDRGRQNDVSDIARAAKDLAMDCDTVVMALSQLSRKPEERNDKRPMLADLRDSGEIEQAADTVIGLYRDEQYDPESVDVGIMELIVLKQRNGQSGVTARAAWDGERTTVRGLARGYGRATVTQQSRSEGPPSGTDEAGGYEEESPPTPEHEGADAF